MLIDGKKIAGELRTEIAGQVEAVKQEIGRVPKLCVLLVGNDYGSSIYVRNKEKACHEVGMASEVFRLPEETTEQEVIGLVNQLNGDDTVDGILVQLPLPGHICEANVVESVDWKKDVDGLQVISSGRLLQGLDTFLPCTPHGIIQMLDKTGIPIAGKRAVVIGRSNIVGKPVSLLLLQRNATVTICHSRTKNLADITRQADILVSAVGRVHMVTADMVKPGAAVIDVGMNRGEDGKVTGDVDFAAVSTVAGYITPVPGGVGPMTITMLLYNTLRGARTYGKK